MVKYGQPCRGWRERRSAHGLLRRASFPKRRKPRLSGPSTRAGLPTPWVSCVAGSDEGGVLAAGLDRAGVLAKIAGILGAYFISLKYVTQKGLSSNGSITIVMLTHLAKEEDVKKALSEISALDVVTDIPVLIRIEAGLEEEEEA